LTPLPKLAQFKVRKASRDLINWDRTGGRVKPAGHEKSKKMRKAEKMLFYGKLVYSLRIYCCCTKKIINNVKIRI